VHRLFTDDLFFYSKLVEFFQGAVEDVAVNEALYAINASAVRVLPKFPFALVL
jgi:hypothetical protein